MSAAALIVSASEHCSQCVPILWLWREREHSCCWVTMKKHLMRWRDLLRFSSERLMKISSEKSSETISVILCFVNWILNSLYSARESFWKNSLIYWYIFAFVLFCRPYPFFLFLSHYIFFIPSCQNDVYDFVLFTSKRVIRLVLFSCFSSREFIKWISSESDFRLFFWLCRLIWLILIETYTNC